MMTRFWFTDRVASPIGRRLARAPSQIALGLMNIPSISEKLEADYQQRLLHHKGRLPMPGGIGAEIVSTLHQKGYYCTTLDALELEGSSKLMQLGQNLVAQHKDGARIKRHYDRHFSSYNSKDMIRENEIYKWGLNHTILEIVENYIGLPVAYDGVQLFYTFPGGIENGVRRWHRDREDRKMIKVAIYLTDVDEQSGPLQILIKNHYKQTKSKHYHYDSIVDREIKHLYDDNLTEGDVFTCLGLSGTVIFVDTASHYHRGRPAERQDRAAFYFSYFSNVPRHPFLCDRSGLSCTDIEVITSGLTVQQKRAARWRTALRGPAAYIPSHPR